MTYQLLEGNTSVIKIDGDQLKVIPFEEGNSDYRSYLEWIAEGNTPQDPVEVPQPQLWSLFWAQLSESAIYQKIKSQATLDPAILVISIEFLNLLTDAKMSLVSCACMQEKIDELIAAGDFVQTDLDEFNALLVNANLDSELTAAFPV